jgi:hypothetical protein
MELIRREMNHVTNVLNMEPMGFLECVAITAFNRDYPTIN